MCQNARVDCTNECVNSRDEASVNASFKKIVSNERKKEIDGYTEGDSDAYGFDACRSWKSRGE